MLLAGVAGHKVEQHADTFLVRSFKQRGGVGIGAVARGDLFVVPHVVPGVLERRVVAGVDPQRVAAKVLDVIQFSDDAGEIADAIPVGIIKTLGIDLVEYSVF